MKSSSLRSCRLLHIHRGPALLFIIVIYSFSVALMSKSGFGMSSIAAVPFLLSRVFPFFRFGTWNFLIQAILILSLTFLGRKWKTEYLFSFILAFAFSKMIDVHELWLRLLPDSFLCRVLCFTAGFFIMALGIYVSNNSHVPIMPTDLFPRDVTALFSLSYATVKTIYDITFLAAALFLSVGYLHQLLGIGIGTVICALFTGKTVEVIQNKLSKRLLFIKTYKTA